MAIYLDYAATTPVDPEVVQAMADYWTREGVFGNPSSVHAFGRAARHAVDRAREEVARLVGAEPSEVIFTSGATEADNLAILGLMRASGRRQLVVGATEHHAVLHAAEEWAKAGGEVQLLPVDAQGRPRVDLLPSLVSRDTGLISLMLGNNEVGAIPDLRAARAAADAVGALLHSDAVQAAAYLAIDLRQLGVDALSLSAHKLYGPKGVGALVVRRGVRLDPLIVGGSQERGRRAGTENVPAVVGFGKAAELVRERRAEEVERVRTLARHLERRLLAIPGAERNGPPWTERLPHIVNVRFQGVDGESLLLSLDLEGVAVSSGSACTSGSLSPSHVLLAMGQDKETAREAIRFSLGRLTTEAEIEQAAEKTARVVERIRRTLAVRIGTKGGEVG